MHILNSRCLHTFHRCLENLDSLTDGQVTVDSVESDETQSTTNLHIEISPSSGPYKGGRFQFRITLWFFCPTVAPEVTCLNKVYHPNIDPTEIGTNVCISILDEWLPKYGLDDVIQGLLFLFHQPNLEDPLSPFFDPDMDEGLFLHNVQCSLLGQEVEGFKFDSTVVQNSNHDNVTNVVSRHCNVNIFSMDNDPDIDPETFVLDDIDDCEDYGNHHHNVDQPTDSNNSKANKFYNLPLCLLDPS